MPESIDFIWPSSGAMRITMLRGGGCSIRITFADRGVVHATGHGRVVKAVAIPTRRIARRYEIRIRHEDDFESSYSIVDQTPSSRTAGRHDIVAEGEWVQDATELYAIQNGGFLDFQLTHRGKLVDPRNFIKSQFEGAIDVTSQAADAPD